jgi:hypothetical protein
MNQPPPLTKPPNWWERNWKWAVPVIVIGAITAMIAFVGVLVFGIFGLIKSTDAYQMAIARMEASPVVVEALGSPIEEGLFVTGNINTSGSSGEADLAIPLSGPKENGTLYVVAQKSVGQWSFTQLVLVVSGSGDRIDLLAPAVADQP